MPVSQSRDCPETVAYTRGLLKDGLACALILCALLTSNKALTTMAATSTTTAMTIPAHQMLKLSSQALTDSMHKVSQEQDIGMMS